jgi:dihydroorotase
MSFDLILRDAAVVTPGGVVAGDLGVREGRVADLAPRLAGSATVEHDCGGDWVFPGGIDPHVHLRDPGNTHKEDLASGTLAALCAGVTTVLDMPNTRPMADSAARVAEKLALAREKAWCRVGFYIAAAPGNLGEIREAEARGLACGVKFFLGATTGALASGDARALEQVLGATRLTVAVHAEDEGRVACLRAALSEPTDPADFALHHARVRDAQAALQAVEECVGAARRAGRRLHLCHVSSAPELAFLQGVPREVASVEVTPHHAGLSLEHFGEVPPAWLKVNPPIRGEADRAALEAAVLAGRADLLGSDHAPHTAAEKAARAYPQVPSGVPGVETLPLLVQAWLAQGRLDPVRAAWLTAGAAAQVFGLADLGEVRPGAWADLAVWPRALQAVPFDPARVRSRCGWSPFAGLPLPERGPRLVVLGGRVVARDGRLTGCSGPGVPGPSVLRRPG